MVLELRGRRVTPVVGAPAGAAYRSAARSWHPDRWTTTRPRDRAAAAENFARGGAADARLRDDARVRQRERKKERKKRKKEGRKRSRR